MNMGVEDGPVPPAEVQASAYRFLKENESAVAAVVLKAIFEKYPEIRETYGDSCEDGELPDIESPEDLKKLIGLGIIHVLPVAKDGIAYLGFEMGCTWDGEHGLGVMLHKDRTVDVGGADTSFLEWIAEADGGEFIWDES
ncbi:DUF6985 domain-containing protein [Singulisphaera rosea]